MKPVTPLTLSRPVLAVALAVLGFVAGCDSGGSTARPPDARPLEPTSQDFGDVEVHYNAMLTDELTPEVARAYGIERSGNRVLLNVSMLQKDPTGKTTPIDGVVSAAARNLNGQLKDLQMRRIQEGSSARSASAATRSSSSTSMRLRAEAAAGTRFSSSASSMRTDRANAKKPHKKCFDAFTTLVFVLFFAR
jgi:hypothetical protein